MHMLGVVVVEVVVVEVVGYMLELELGRSSYNDVSRLEVVVEQVGQELLGVLGVQGHLGRLVLLVLLVVQVVLLGLVLLALLVVPLVLRVLGVLELVEVVEVVVVVVGVGEEEVHMVQLALKEWLWSRLVILGSCRHPQPRRRILRLHNLHSHNHMVLVIVFG